MVKDKLVNCDNCAGVTDKNRVNFSSRIKNSDCTVNQAIQLFFPSVLTTTPSRPKKDLRYLCQKCSLQLGTAYIKLQEFKERTKDNTYIGRKLVISVQHLPQQYEEPCTSASALDSHLSENAEYCISENNDLERASLLQEEESEVESENEAQHPAGRSEGALQRKSTPIGQKLKNVFSRTNQKSFKSLRSNINRIINAELAVLGDNSSFGSQSSGDLFPSLDVIYEECENFAPVTLSILGALVGLGEGLFTPAMRSIVGIALYQRRMHDNIFAKSVGALLWKNGVSVKTYTLFHEMGISVCYKTILNYMETQQKTFDKPVRDWKKEIEDELVSSQNPRSRNARPMFQPEEATSSLSCLRIYESSDDEINVTPGITSTPARSLSLKRGSLARKKLNFSDVSTQEESFKSFCLSYDNLNKSIHPRHYGNTNTLHSLNVVVFIAIRDRIATPWRMVLSPRPILDPIDIPMSAFVLQESEVTTMKQLHLREIILILQENLDVFFKTDKRLSRYPEHEYMVESAKKSEIVNLGVIPHNEGTIDGMINCLKEMQDYVPKKPDGNFLPIVTWGDGLTAINQKASQDHRCHSLTEEDKVRSMFGIHSYWHERAIVGTEIMKSLLSNQRVWETKGSLNDLKLKYKHKLVSQDVIHQFNPCMRFLRFALRSYVVAYARLRLTTINISGLSKAQLNQLMSKIGMDLMEMEFADILRPCKQKQYCFCLKPYDAKDKTTEWICCDNYDCSENQWYHQACIKKYTAKRGNMKWKKITKDSFTGKWYCTEKCMKDDADQVFKYTKTLLYSILNLECFRSAINFNHGDNIMIFRKLHLITYQGKSHKNYLNLTHYYLSLLHGFAPEHVAHAMKWNSTCNTNGGQNKNNPHDIVTEFVVGDTKEAFSHSSGKLTEKMIRIRGSSGGNLAEIEKRAAKELMGEEFTPVVGKAHRFLLEVTDCSQYLVSECENLFVKHTNLSKIRVHSGFENFNNDFMYIGNYFEYEKAMKNLSKNLSKISRIQNRKYAIDMNVGVNVLEQDNFSSYTSIA